MDALLDHDIMFDYVVGVSAGITYAISYLSRQRVRNRDVLRRDRRDSRYLGVRNLPHDHSIFGTDFVFDTIPNQLIPFDWEAYHRYKGRILVGVTNAETGRAEYLDGAKLDRTCTMLRATCAIPLYFPAVQLSGGTFYDGGVADPIPIVRSLHDGNRKNLIVLTQPKGYRKTLTRGSKFAAHALRRKYPAMTETMLARPGLYNDTVCLCRRLAEENPADTVLSFSGRVTAASAGALDREGGTLTGAFADRDRVTLTLEGGRTETVCLRQSSLPSLRLILNGTTLDQIHQDKDVKYPGNDRRVSHYHHQISKRKRDFLYTASFTCVLDASCNRCLRNLVRNSGSRNKQGNIDILHRLYRMANQPSRGR